MKKLMKEYLNNWFIPIIVSAFLGLLGLFGLKNQNIYTLYLSIGIPFLALILSFSLGIHKLWLKKYQEGTLQIIITGILSILGLLLVNSFMWANPHDYFAAHLEIPKNIDLHEVKGQRFNESIPRPDSGVHKPHLFFDLYQGTQPGIYYYDVWLSRIDSGTVYLKAVEITQNTWLSAGLVGYNSTIEVYNPTDSIIRYTHTKPFRINEGNWGNYYAARFELWFQPINGNSSRKLAEKIYKIEGWMR